MTELANEFYAWIMSRATELGAAVEGCVVEAPDDEHIVISTEYATAHVNFYQLDPDRPEVIELNIIPTDDPDNPTFFLHFEMDDLEHAKSLFNELVDTLTQLTEKTVTKVLLTCTSAMTTTFFARKLQETADEFGLDFTFEATNIERALTIAGDYDAVMLAPQVHSRRAEMVAAHPDLIVFEIPGSVFGSYDARTALRMLLEAFTEHALAAQLEQKKQKTTRIMRNLDNKKRILVISAAYGRTDASYAYRVYDCGEIASEGRVTKRIGNLEELHEMLESVRAHGFNARDMEDVLATVRVAGYHIRDFDAIGFALPGIIDGTLLRNVGWSTATHDFSELQAWASEQDILMQVDNSANAAAVGCYVSQDAHESIVLHRQPTGYAVGSQGVVTNGRLIRGSHGLAGELTLLAKYLGDPNQLEEKAWTSEGMRELVTMYLLTSIVTCSPEAIYVAVDLLPDMDELHTELEKALPEGSVPELIYVDDFHELVLVGEYALCLNALRRAAALEQS